MVKRIYVEKKQGYDVEAKHLLTDLQTNLGITNLSGLRLFIRYDCEGITLDEYEKAKNNIFHDPMVDHLYEENIPDIPDSILIATQLLPGQYNQHADITMQSLKLLNTSSQAKVISGKLIALTGPLTPDDIEKIKKYYINPVESEEVSIEKPATLEMPAPEPSVITTIKNFGPHKMDELGLAMSEADCKFCADYFFNEEKRDPTLTEIRVLDTYWSDHCRHTTFLTELENVEIQPDYIKSVYDDYLETKLLTAGASNAGAPTAGVSLMSIATTPAKHLAKLGKLPELDISEEINACSIEIPIKVERSTAKRKLYSPQHKTEKFLLMFKNETHNHPTEIEPFGGAATCLGGGIRDPLSGRSYVYQAMRLTGSGDPRQKISDTLPGKLPQRKITTTAAAGYSSYGNQIGLPAGQVAEIYDDGYVAKRMECGALVAAAPKENVIRQTPAPTDVVILLGGKTGRDGCGGATGSSKTHDSDTTTTAGAEVQRGNAPGQRGIVRLFRDPTATRLIKRCNDFGAGGVSVAIGELADGLTINLDRVPKKYEGLDGTELAISESQERMAVVVSAKDADTFIKLAEQENLEATVVAEVTAEPRLVMYWRGQKIVDMSRKFLNSNGVPRKSSATIQTPNTDSFFTNPPDTDSKPIDLMKSKLSSLNFCSQKGLVERFDSTIGVGTVLNPLGGETQLTPPDCMVAKIPVLDGDTSACSFMSYAYTPELSRLSPFHGAAYAVLESIAKIVSTGGDWRKVYLSFQEFFEKLGDKPIRWGKPLAALLGAYHAQMNLERAAIGGKDSMSGSYIPEDAKDSSSRIDVPPALISFAVGYGNSEYVISPEFKRAGHDLVLVEIPRDGNNLPDWETAKSNFDNIHKLILEERVFAARSLGEHGLFGSIIQCFGNKVGAQIDDENEDIYAPRIGDILIEVSSGKSIGFGRVVGHTVSEEAFFHGTENIGLDQAIKLWSEPLADVFPPEDTAPTKFIEFNARNIVKPKAKIASPRVFIPAFPGTNCEYDISRVFEKAGAIPEIVVMRNLTASDIEQSIDKMAQTIDNSQIMVLAGGFDAIDGLGNAAQYTVSLLQHPRIADSIMRLMNERDGLILGISGGFQALIKSGLLPYGEIRETTPETPTLTFNTIGRHISKMVKTRICSNLSPWLAHMRVGEEYVIPISHGEGRFVAPKNVLTEMQNNGQIATQYVNNPNGSELGIEGITSPDGRIFGKTGHSERFGPNVSKNIYGNKEQNIFKNGVEYYA